MEKSENDQFQGNWWLVFAPIVLTEEKDNLGWACGESDSRIVAWYYHSELWEVSKPL